MTDGTDHHPSNLMDGLHFTRRETLRTSAVGAAAIGASGLLAACGGSSSSSSSTTASTGGKPVRGGTLRAGLTGGATTDTLDPINPLTLPDFCRLAALYDPLITYGSNALPQLQLAEEITPNKDATEWIIRVRKGILFHDGSELNADDVNFTLSRIQNPKAPGEGAAEILALNMPAATKLDKYTLKIPCHTPFSVLPSVLAGYYFNVVPVGFDKRHPIGTGPYKFQEFTPGVQSTFVRNPNYWKPGLPYTDTLIVTDYSDGSSQVNAMLAGQVDLINNLTAQQIPSVQGNGHTPLISLGGGWNPFVMNLAQAPWNDVNVRQAMRMLVDRKQMINLVFAGHGLIGNDIFGIYDPEYDHAIPQRQLDVEQARSLLKAAGRENMTVTLTTGTFAQGTLQAAQVLAQQASAAGVTVKLDNVNTAAYFGPNYTHYNFGQSYWNWYTYLVQAAQVTVPHATFPETHFNNARYGQLYNEAIGTTDMARQTELVHEMQMIDYTQGGYIVPFFPPVIDAYANNVHGLITSKVGVSFNNFDLASAWIA